VARFDLPARAGNLADAAKLWLKAVLRLCRPSAIVVCGSYSGTAANSKGSEVDAIGMYVGLGLVVVGVLLFVAGQRKRRSTVSSNSSVAVGGNNSGSIVNVNQSSAPAAHSGGHGLSIAAIIVELIGIAVTLWHAFHLASK